MYNVTNKLKKITVITTILLMVILIVFSTVAYSAFASTMHITGTAHARVESNVRITDFRIASTNNATSSYEEFGKNHIVSNVDLKSSSSSITYFLEITNYGSVDVGILNITGLPNGINYSINDYKLHDKICNESGKCNGFITKTYELTLTSNSSYAGNIQMNFDFRTYRKVTYTNIENNNYPTEVIDGGNLSITFKENLKRVQILSNNNELAFYNQITNNQTVTVDNITNDVEIKIVDQIARLSYGSLESIGSEVCIGKECFYIISNDGSKVAMLSKYNLHVANRYDDINGVLPLENPTGIQDENAKGWFGGYTLDNPIVGTSSFSSTNYWVSTVSNYSTYVYNKNSSLYEYLVDYKKYLENLGSRVKNVRLISKDELSYLGCDGESISCIGAPNWVYSTTYWSGSAGSSTCIWYVNNIGGFGCRDYIDYHYGYGVRPVIELDVDDIYVPVAKVMSGSIDEVGSEICIGEECFYTISSDNDTVTMLSKYNLLVGNKYDDTNGAVALENPSGIQDETAKGWFEGYSVDNPLIGTIPFSSTNYWASTVTSYSTYVYNENSLLYEYVENYKNYLEGLGTIINDARLISLEELRSLGCSISINSCASAPEWVYSTTYWTGIGYSEINIWNVISSNYYCGTEYSIDNRGVRPVITIPKKSIIDTF